MSGEGIPVLFEVVSKAYEQAVTDWDRNRYFERI